MSDLDCIKLGVGLPPLPSDADFSQHMAEYIGRCINAKMSKYADLQEKVEELKNDVYKYHNYNDYLLEQIDELKRELECVKKKTKYTHCDRHRFASDIRGYELELNERWAKLNSGVPDQEAKYTQLFTDILGVGGRISVSDDGRHEIRFTRI